MEGTTHELKCWPEYFQAVKSGSKTFELRKDDRGFQVGDVLRLQEYSLDTGYSGDELTVSVTYKLEAHPRGFTGIEPGYCILGIQKGDKDHD